MDRRFVSLESTPGYEVISSVITHFTIHGGKMDNHSFILIWGGVSPVIEVFLITEGGIGV